MVLADQQDEIRRALVLLAEGNWTRRTAIRTANPPMGHYSYCGRKYIISAFAQLVSKRNLFETTLLFRSAGLSSAELLALFQLSQGVR
jgi:hypothetical protein